MSGRPSRRARAANDQAAVPGRRDAILAIAAEIFAQKGFVATTVREIADEAGILSGSLYHHFDSKETMVDEIIGDFVDAMVERYAHIVEDIDDPLEALQALIRAAFEVVVPQWAAFTVAHNESQYLLQFERFAHLREGYGKVDELWMTVLERGIAGGVFKPDMDVQFAYLLMREGLWVSARLLKRNSRTDIEQLSNDYIEFVLDGIRVDRRAKRAKRAKST